MKFAVTVALLLLMPSSAHAYNQNTVDKFCHQVHPSDEGLAMQCYETEMLAAGELEDLVQKGLNSTEIGQLRACRDKSPLSLAQIRDCFILQRNKPD